MRETGREGKGGRKEMEKEGGERERGGERGRKRFSIYFDCLLITKLHIFKYHLYLVLYNMLLN